MARWSMLEQIAVEAGDAQKSSMDFIDLFSVCVCVCVGKCNYEL